MEIKQMAEFGMDLLDSKQSFVQITTVDLHGNGVDIAFLKDDGKITSTNDSAFMPEIIDQAKMLYMAADKKNKIVTYYEEIPEDEKMAEDAEADIKAQYMIEFISHELAENEVFYRELYMALEERLPVRLVLIESKGTNVGKRYQALFKPNGELAGDGAIEKPVREEISKEKGKDNRQVDIDGLTFYLMPIGTQKTVYLIGDTDKVKALCPKIRKNEYRTVVIGLDKSKTNENTLPDADGILIPKTYTDIFFHIPVDEFCSVVVMTGNRDTDTYVLGQALETRGGFISIAGQNDYKLGIIDSLKGYGWQDKDITRVHWLKNDADIIVNALPR